MRSGHGCFSNLCHTANATPLRVPKTCAPRKLGQRVWRTEDWIGLVLKWGTYHEDRAGVGKSFRGRLLVVDTCKPLEFEVKLTHSWQLIYILFATPTQRLQGFATMCHSISITVQDFNREVVLSLKPCQSAVASKILKVHNDIQNLIRNPCSIQVNKNWWSNNLTQYSLVLHYLLKSHHKVLCPSRKTWQWLFRWELPAVNALALDDEAEF